jgi:hypothetical protein
VRFPGCQKRGTEERKNTRRNEKKATHHIYVQLYIVFGVWVLALNRKTKIEDSLFLDSHALISTSAHSSEGDTRTCT